MHTQVQYLHAQVGGLDHTPSVTNCSSSSILQSGKCQCKCKSKSKCSYKVHRPPAVSTAQLPTVPTGSTDHTLFLAPGQGSCHLNYREYPGTVSSLSRGDRGFNGPDFPSPQGPCPQAAAVPGTWSHFPLLCLPVQPRQNRKADHQHVSFSPRSAPSVHSLAHVKYRQIHT